jgi:hypothetical protein
MQWYALLLAAAAISMGIVLLGCLPLQLMAKMLDLALQFLESYTASSPPPTESTWKGSPSNINEPVDCV